MIDEKVALERIESLKQITMHEARKYCPINEASSWVHGYTTAVDDMLNIIDDIIEGYRK